MLLEFWTLVCGRRVTSRWCLTLDTTRLQQSYMCKNIWSSAAKSVLSLFQKISVRIYPEFSKSVVRGLIYHCRISPFQQFSTNSSCLSRQRARSHSAVIQLICKDPEKVVGEGEIIWGRKVGGDNLQSYFLTFKNRASYI